MSNRRRVLKWSIVIVVAASTIGFAAANWSMVRELARGMRSIDPRSAVLGLGCSLLAIVNRGLMNQAAHRSVGLEPGAREMTRTAAVGFAAQKMLRPGGAVGLAVFVRHGRHRGHSAGSVAAACVMTSIAAFTSLGVLLAGAITVLAATDRLTGWWIAAAVGFACYTCAIGALVLIVARSRRIAELGWSRIQRARRRVTRAGRAGAPDVALPSDLFDAVATAQRRPAHVRRLVMHAVASKVLGVAMLAIAVAAAGVRLSVPEALIVYAAALAASTVSIVPGGFGAVEGSIAALLLAGGATAAAAALAVALFRLFDLWFPVLGGVALARGELRTVEAATPANLSEPVEPQRLAPVMALPWHTPEVAVAVAA